MMGRIVAVSGLCGAGKSTAVSFLARTTGGEEIYFGATVLRVVRERGLPETSASEQTVRVDLRDLHGAAYLAMMEADRLKALLAAGRNVFVDAIYCVEEIEFLAGLAARFFHIGIETCFESRLIRLSARTVRPMTEAQLRQRDAVDLNRLKNGDVIARASVRINNEGSRGELENALRHAVEQGSY